MFFRYARRVFFGILHQKIAVRNSHSDNLGGLKSACLKRSSKLSFTCVSGTIQMVTLLQKFSDLLRTNSGFSAVLQVPTTQGGACVDPAAIVDLPEHHQRAKLSQCMTQSSDRMAVKRASNLSNDVHQLWCSRAHLLQNQPLLHSDEDTKQSGTCAGTSVRGVVATWPTRKCRSLGTVFSLGRTWCGTMCCFLALHAQTRWNGVSKSCSHDGHIGLMSYPLPRSMCASKDATRAPSEAP